jgi:thiol:disulfide interchange protein
VKRDARQEFLMKQIFASILTTVLIIALTLAAMFALVGATLKVTAIESPVERAFAIGAELVLGIVLLLGTVWVATHLAVRIFHVQESKSSAGDPNA